MTNFLDEIKADAVFLRNLGIEAGYPEATLAIDRMLASIKTQESISGTASAELVAAALLAVGELEEMQAYRLALPALKRAIAGASKGESASDG